MILRLFNFLQICARRVGNANKINVNRKLGVNAFITITEKLTKRSNFLICYFSAFNLMKLK
jgi:hypothetical protein